MGDKDGRGLHRVAVVGGGHNGLVAAAYLAKAGCNVELFEASERLGGLAAPISLGHGREAVIPRWCDRLSQDIIDDLDLEDHGLVRREIKQTVNYVVIGPDGQQLILRSNFNETLVELLKFGKSDALGFLNLNAQIRAAADHISQTFATKPPGRNRDYYNPLHTELNAFFLRLSRLTARELVAHYLQSDFLRVLQLIKIGEGPISYDTVGGFWTSVFHHTFLRETPMVAEAGLGSFLEALERAARASGIQIRLGSRVNQVVALRGGGFRIEVQGDPPRQVDALFWAAPPSQLAAVLDPSSTTAGWPAQIAKVERRSEALLLRVFVVLKRPPEGPAAGLAGDDLRRAEVVFLPRLETLTAHLNRVISAADQPTTRMTQDDADSMILSCYSSDPFLSVPAGFPYVLKVGIRYVPRTWLEGNARAETETFIWARLRQVLTQTFGMQPNEILAVHLIGPERFRELGYAGFDPSQLSMVADRMLTGRPIVLADANLQSGYASPLPGLYFAAAHAWPGGGITGLPGRNAVSTALTDLSGLGKSAMS